MQSYNAALTLPVYAYRPHFHSISISSYHIYEPPQNLSLAETDQNPTTAHHLTPIPNLS